MPNFTTEDLLVYMYNETDPQQLTEIESALTNDWALKQKYQVLIEAQERLSQTKLRSPRQHTVDVILKYAGSKMHLSN